ncbi:cytochrome c4 [Flagellatimonas centrodinii]|uniref:c-type cytochrome n=1 Tax=Flagellatimonas centrodinii TaxID=2806210 RepID=UPI001FF07B64|nr:c-type cytochrome [Flagellatimonas centrodinii]ULQ45154.1 cytochrome c4 [Flagellatimonas centrodinii]
MKRLVLALSLCLPLFAAAETTDGNLFTGGDVARGESKAATCGACHGPKGNSGNPEWPSLAGQGAPYLKTQLEAFRSGARKNVLMSSQAAGLSDQDIADLAAYYAAQTAKPGVASEASVAVAQPLYRAGDAERGIPGCAGCHGPTGAGNPAAAYPHLAGQHATYTAAALRAYRSGERGGSHNGQMMVTIAKQLTDEEIEALASYLNGLQ